MRWFAVCAAFVSCLMGQEQAATDIFEKAPPAVDEALRQRVSGFFQAHVDKKFRQADAFVAEDSKDAFFTMEKQPYLSFEIVKIVYSDQFTKAKVITANGMEWRSPRIGKVLVKPPMTSLWKLENGQWFWYVLPSEQHRDTPFGRMTPGPDNPNPTILDAFKGVSPQQVANSVKVDRPEVRLSSYEPASETVTVTNSMPGEVSLQLMVPLMAGLQAKLDKALLKPNDTATISFQYVPKDKSAKETVVVTLRVEQTNQNIPIRLTFAVPPEVEKRINSAR